MKQLLTILILSLCLTGCSEVKKSAPSSLPQASQESSAPSSIAQPIQKKFTKDDAMAIFRNGGSTDILEPVDCVLVDDGYERLDAVVLYYNKTQNNTACELAFIANGVFIPIGIAVDEVAGVKDYVISDDNKFKYIGNGTVSFSLRDVKSNKIFDYTAKYEFKEENGAPCTNFIINSDVRK